MLLLFSEFLAAVGRPLTAAAETEAAGAAEMLMRFSMLTRRRRTGVGVCPLHNSCVVLHCHDRRPLAYLLSI